MCKIALIYNKKYFTKWKMTSYFSRFQKLVDFKTLSKSDQNIAGNIYDIGENCSQKKQNMKNVKTLVFGFVWVFGFDHSVANKLNGNGRRALSSILQPEEGNWHLFVHKV